jgi:hypothetical protein
VETNDAETYQSCQNALLLLLDLVQEGYGVDANSDVSTALFQSLISTVSNFFYVNVTAYSLSMNTTTSLQLDSVMKQLTSGLLLSLANGQAAVSFISGNVRLAVQKEYVLDASSVTFSSPTTDEEDLLDMIPSTMAFDSNADITACDSGQGFIHLVTSGVSHAPSSTSNISSELTSTIFGLQTSRTSNSSLIEVNATTSTNSTPAYYITLQFKTGYTLPNYNLSVEEILSSGRNFTFPICRIYDSASDTYQSCSGCEPFSYTSSNITFACYEMEQICGGEGGDILSRRRRRLEMSAWNSYVNSLSEVQYRDSTWGRSLQANDDSDDYLSTSSTMTAQQYAAIFVALANAFVDNLSANPFAITFEEAVPMLVLVGSLIAFMCLGGIYLWKMDVLEQDKWHSEVSWPPNVSRSLIWWSLFSDISELWIALATKKSTKVQEKFEDEDTISSRRYGMEFTKPICKYNEDEASDDDDDDDDDDKESIQSHCSILGEYDTYQGAGNNSLRLTYIDNEMNNLKMNLKQGPQSMVEVGINSEGNHSLGAISQMSNADVKRAESTRLITLVNNIVPNIFRSNENKDSSSSSLTTKGSISSFLLTLWYNHSYLTHFTRTLFTKSHFFRWMMFCKTLMLTLLIDTLFFQIFYSNDGTCELYVTAETCVAESNPVTGNTKCAWANSQCSMQGPPESFLFLIMLALLTMIITIPLDALTNIPMDLFCLQRPDWSKSIWDLLKPIDDDELAIGNTNIRQRFEKFLVEARSNEQSDRTSMQIKKLSTKVEIHRMPSALTAELDMLRLSLLQHFNAIQSMGNDDPKSFTDMVHARSAVLLNNFHITMSGQVEPLSVWEQLLNPNLFCNMETSRNRTLYVRLNQLVEDLRRARREESRLYETFVVFRHQDQAFVGAAPSVAQSMGHSERDISAATMWDHMLISSFLLEHLTPLQRYLVVSKLGCLDEFMFPAKVHYIYWCAAWFWLWGLILFSLYWMMQWCVNDGRVLLYRWGINFVIGAVQDICLAEVVKLYLFYMLACILVLPDLVSVQQWLRHILLQEKSVDADDSHQGTHLLPESRASKRYYPTSDFSVVQHVSPTCRLARRLYCENGASKKSLNGSQAAANASNSVFTRIFAEFDDYDAYQCNHWQAAKPQRPVLLAYSSQIVTVIIIAVLIVLLVDEQIADVAVDVFLMGFSSSFLLVNNLIASLPAQKNTPWDGKYYLIAIYVVLLLLVIVWWLYSEQFNKSFHRIARLSRQEHMANVADHPPNNKSLARQRSSIKSWWSRSGTSWDLNSSPGEVSQSQSWAMLNRPEELQPRESSPSSLQLTEAPKAGGVNWMLMFAEHSISKVAHSTASPSEEQEMEALDIQTLQELQHKLRLWPRSDMLQNWKRHYRNSIQEDMSIMAVDKRKMARSIRMETYHLRERLSVSLSASLLLLARTYYFLCVACQQERESTLLNETDAHLELLKGFSASNEMVVVKKDGKKDEYDEPIEFGKPTRANPEGTKDRKERIPSHVQHTMSGNLLKALEIGDESVLTNFWVSASVGSMILTHMLSSRCRPEGRLLSTGEMHELLANMHYWMRLVHQHAQLESQLGNRSNNSNHQNNHRVPIGENDGVGVYFDQFRVWFVAVYSWYSQPRKIQRQRKRKNDVDGEFLPLLLLHYEINAKIKN